MTTDAPTTTLTTWLLAQLDAVEAVARAATPGPWSVGVGRTQLEVASADDDLIYRRTNDMQAPRDAAHIALHDPAHVLAQIAAVRAVVKMHVPLDPWYDTERLVCAACLTDRRGVRDEWEPDSFPCPTLLTLAQPYAGRAGWDESWAL